MTLCCTVSVSLAQSSIGLSFVYPYDDPTLDQILRYDTWALALM